MADKKISTIILELDIDCSCCVKKITKKLNKYLEIQTKVFNHEKKTATISGPFNPEKLVKSICCKAGKYIKSYEIVVDKPEPDEKPKPHEKLDPKPHEKPDPKPHPKPVVIPVLPVIPVMLVQPYPVWVNCGHCFNLHLPGPSLQIWGGPYKGYCGPCSSPGAPPAPSACTCAPPAPSAWFSSEEESTCGIM